MQYSRKEDFSYVRLDKKKQKFYTDSPVSSVKESAYMDDRIYAIARKRVRERKRFYKHLFSWFVMSVFFVFINLVTSDYFWAIFPILSWGIGLAFHGMRVFAMDYGEDWEERQIEKEMERLRKRKYGRESYHEDHEETSYREDRLELPNPRSFRRKWNDSDLV